MFRANDKEYDTLVAENRFVTDIQMEIERAMEDQNISQAELARALEISEARVSQVLAGNGKNLQARTIARIAHILGLRACVEFKDQSWSSVKLDPRKWTKVARMFVNYDWNVIANENELMKAA
jgi:transcriptional regulator with XRE-family HTH domain